MRASVIPSRARDLLSRLHAVLQLLFLNSRVSRLSVVLAVSLHASSVQAQPVSLQLRPRVGDTLRMEMDQDIEMWGTIRIAGIDSTRATKTTFRVITHALVLKSDMSGTTLSAVADSVTVSTNDERGAGALSDARRRLIGRAVQLWMAPDGETKLVSAEAGADPGVGQLFAQMPATLPRETVKVGASWTKEMNVPATGMSGPGGVLRTKFRLDSLTNDGHLAWISIAGVLKPPKGFRGDGNGGTVTGALVVDRRRGWLVDARTTTAMRSVLGQPSAAGREPMYFRMRVTQRVRVIDQ